MPKVAAVIPARNARDRIASTVRAVADVGAVDLVVVVDSGSTDGTADAAREAGAVVLSHSGSGGRTAAMETGAQAVAAIDVRDARKLPRHLLFLDADLGSAAADVGALIAPVLDGKADLSVATSSPRPGVAERLATFGVVRLTGWRPTDPLARERCLTREAYTAASPLSYGFGADVGLTIDVVRKGFRVVEVPVEFPHRPISGVWPTVQIAGAVLRRRLARSRTYERETPVFLYDGDCGFCTRSVEVVEDWIPTRARIEAWQFADLDALGVAREQAEYEVVWIGADGTVDGGARGFARLLVDAGGAWSVLGRLILLPPFRWVAHGCYRLIANNRYRLPGGTPACALPADQRPGRSRLPRLDSSE